MRGRAWVAWSFLLAGLLLGIAGRRLPAPDAWNLLAGLLFLVAFVLALSLLPLWRRLVPDPMPGLFRRPTPSQRWCTGCGQPAPRRTVCPACGSTPPSSGN